MPDKTSGNDNTKARRSFYEPVYTIGIAAKMLNMSVQNIRLYESEGLIIPFRTDTDRRLYSDMEIEKIGCIRSMIKNDGLNFEGIRRLIALVPCWKLRKCNSRNGARCPAYKNRTSPCWSTEEKCLHPLASCRDCDVYKNITECEDVRKLIQST